jgi:hypothetical protein
MYKIGLWNDEELKYLFDNIDKFTLVEIANHLNRKIKSVAYQSQKYKLKHPSKLIGKKYNKLTIISTEYRINKRTGYNNSYATCICDCGKIKTINLAEIKRGRAKGCGCLPRIISNPRKRSLDIDSRLYKIYHGIKQRCYNKQDLAYKYYGLKGIIMCDEWLKDFQNFKKWSLNNGYEDNLSIDRIDFDGNYSPDNCRWVNNIVQANNRSNNHIIIAFGEEKTLQEWGRDERCKSSPCLIRSRIVELGWGAEKAIVTPSMQKKSTRRKAMNNKQFISDRLYIIWKHMYNRIYKKSSKGYKNYGGRGIKLCEEWLIPKNFYRWALENGYDNNLSLNRIDNDGDYCPKNCSWATIKEQANNKRNTVYTTAFGETKSILDWIEDNRCIIKNKRLIIERIRKLKWSPEKAMTTESIYKQ